MPKIDHCSECDATLKDGVCLNCGWVKNPMEEKKPEESQEPQEGKVEEEPAEEHTEVTSIFTDIVKKSKEDVEVSKTPQEITTQKKNIVVPAILAIALLLVAAISYYLFVYSTPQFLSPLVLSAQDIKDQKEGNYDEDNIGDIPLTELSETEKTLELESNLVEGNLQKYNFAQFAAPDTQMFVHVFNIQNILEMFDGADLYSLLKEEFDFEDDDVSVYLSDGFALVYPGDDLNRWGFIVGVEDKDFIEERVEQFNDAKESDDEYEYADFAAEVVEVNGETLDLTADLENEDGTEGQEESEAESGDEIDQGEEDTSSTTFLVISNSNEYIDQMIESSEGNLSNLEEDLQFVQSKVDLPKVGQAYIYKKQDASVWNVFADYVSSKYEYEGLNKILQDIKSKGLVIYSVANKLRIVGSTN